MYNMKPKRKALKKIKRLLKKGFRITFKKGNPEKACKIKGQNHTGQYCYRSKGGGSLKFD